MVQVPVVIANYRSGADEPNRVVANNANLELGVGGDGEAALTKVVLHRRFFLWDNLSGRRVLDAASRTKAEATGTASQSGSDMLVVRWARYVELRVKLRADASDSAQGERLRLFPPYLVVDYDQQMVSTIPQEQLPDGDVREAMRYPSITFKATYTMDLANYWYITMILFIVLVVLMVMALGIKVSVRQQASALSPPAGVVADIFGTIADAFFWGLFFMCGYWFFFFKLQSDVKVLLPLQNPHPTYLIIIIVSIVLKILQVLLLVYRQCTVDVFFIDWEKERGGGGDDKANSDAYNKDKPSYSNVSVWRSILIANEWCEMQAQRHTDIDLSLMFLLLFQAGLDLEFLATPQPNSLDLSPGSFNYALRFFTIAMWYFAIVLTQLAYKGLTYRFMKDPLDLFVDLCQLANISTFLLDEMYHGYYIHGRAVHPFTDVNMLTMQLNLQAESDGKLPYRCVLLHTRQGQMVLNTFSHISTSIE